MQLSLTIGFSHLQKEKLHHEIFRHALVANRFGYVSASGVLAPSWAQTTCDASQDHLDEIQTRHQLCNGL